MRSMEFQLGIQPAEDGRVAFRPIWDVVNSLIVEDIGVLPEQPDLDFYLGGANKLPLVFSRDGTGKGKLQLTTAALRNPYASKSAQHLRIFGIANLDDGREGTRRIYGEQVYSTRMSMAHIVQVVQYSAPAVLCKTTRVYCNLTFKEHRTVADPLISAPSPPSRLSVASTGSTSVAKPGCAPPLRRGPYRPLRYKCSKREWT